MHVLFVIFVVFGLLLTVVGGYRKWGWVSNPWFRVIHLGGVGIVLTQSWVGIICPLTTLEMWLRGRAGETQYDGSFIQYWLQRVLYYDASPWVFVAAYTIVGLLVITTWVRFPPHFKSRGVHRST